MICSSQLNRSAPLISLLAILVTFSFGCNKGPASEPTTTGTPQPITSSIPPFATREPERYSAKRVITITRNGSPVREETTLIVRDGENRREEYQSASVATLVYLETSQGRFVLLPGRKVFADLGNQSAPSPSPLESVELGLEQSRGEATYEPLGVEQLGSRNTTKYRVSYGGHQTSETLVWIDELLHMPIRTETRKFDSSDNVTVVMELRDIKTDVDQRVFAIGADYKKIDSKTLREVQNKAP